MHKDIYPIDPDTAKTALITEKKYKEMYELSLKDPDKFWTEEAKRLEWFKPFSKVKETSFDKPVSIKWYQGGKLNVSYNCLDRHLEKRGNKTAFVWEADNPQTPNKKVTYTELHKEVCRFANVLKKMRSEEHTSELQSH